MDTVVTVHTCISCLFVDLIRDLSVLAYYSIITENNYSYALCACTCMHYIHVRACPYGYSY